MVKQISLGIHIGHDRGAAIIKNGILIAQLSEERLDRLKHSNSPHLPSKSILKLLQWNRIPISEIGVVGISYTNVCIDNVLAELTEEIHDLLNRNDIPVHGFSHHDCHAYSTFFTSPFKESAVLVADGAGDIFENKIEAESVYLAHGSQVELLSKRLQDFGLTRTDRRNTFSPSYIHEIDQLKQISIGRKYEQLTYLIGFKHGEAGKTMGLASYSDPLFNIDEPVFDEFDFSLTFFQYLDLIKDASNSSGLPWHLFLKRNSSAIASLAQDIVEKYVLRIARNLQRITESKNLSLSGGVFLNCLLNHKILENTGFNRVHIIPASGDDGQCVGAGFMAYKKEFAKLQPCNTTLPYLGISYKDHEIIERIEYFELGYQRLSEERLISSIAQILQDKYIIGFFKGRSELGPRALCHRSILANPSDIEMKDRLNILKGRELFRPFAPVIIEEEQFNYFKLKQNSPYMLLATQVKAKYKSKLGAITHVDGTARIQSVNKEKEPFLHKLLKRFEELSGLPVLLNTSFNIAGDPVVETPHDALSTFLSSGLDYLVIENFLIKKPSIMAENTQGL